MHTRLPDPEGAFLDHDAIERLIDQQLGRPTLEQILAASARVDRVLAAGAPGDVRLSKLSLEVA